MMGEVDIRRGGWRITEVLVGKFPISAVKGFDGFPVSSLMGWWTFGGYFARISMR